MSPAAIAEDPQMQPDLHHDQLQAVGKAFDALLLTLYRLTHRHNDLKQYTEVAFKEVLSRPMCYFFSFYSRVLPLYRIPVSNDERI